MSKYELADNLPLGLIIINNKRQVVYCNPKATQIIGYTLEDFQKGLYRPHPEHALFNNMVYDAIHNDISGKNAELLFMHKDGSSIWVTSSWENIGDGEDKKIYVAFQDITIPKLLEKENMELIQELKEANQLKKDFIKNITHEVRTPLTSVLGYTSILMETPLAGDQRNLLSTITTRSEELLELITDIVEYSAATNNSKLKLKVCNPCHVVKDCLEKYIKLAESKNLEVSINYSSDSVLEYYDDRKLEIVIKNLIGNAIKFTHKGKISIEIDYDNKLIVTIVDTGQGISEDNIPMVFEEFYQLEYPGKAKPYGFGIGLPTVWRMLEVMGGHLTISSAKNLGTAVTVVVPPIEVQENEAVNA